MNHETVTRTAINALIREYLAKNERPTAKVLGAHFSTPTSPRISVYLSDWIEENPWEWHKNQLPETIVTYVNDLHSQLDKLQSIITESRINYADEDI